MNVISTIVLLTSFHIVALTSLWNGQRVPYLHTRHPPTLSFDVKGDSLPTASKINIQWTTDKHMNSWKGSDEETNEERESHLKHFAIDDGGKIYQKGCVHLTHHSEPERRSFASDTLTKENKARGSVSESSQKGIWIGADGRKQELRVTDDEGEHDAYHSASGGLASDPFKHEHGKLSYPTDAPGELQQAKHETVIKQTHQADMADVQEDKEGNKGGLESTTAEAESFAETEKTSHQDAVGISEKTNQSSTQNGVTEKQKSQHESVSEEGTMKLKCNNHENTASPSPCDSMKRDLHAASSWKKSPEHIHEEFWGPHPHHGSFEEAWHEEGNEEPRMDWYRDEHDRSMGWYRDEHERWRDSHGDKHNKPWFNWEPNFGVDHFSEEHGNNGHNKETQAHFNHPSSQILHKQPYSHVDTPMNDWAAHFEQEGYHEKHKWGFNQHHNNRWQYFPSIDSIHESSVDQPQTGIPVGNSGRYDTKQKGSEQIFTPILPTIIVSSTTPVTDIFVVEPVLTDSSDGLAVPINAQKEGTLSFGNSDMKNTASKGTVVTDTDVGTGHTTFDTTGSSTDSFSEVNKNEPYSMVGGEVVGVSENTKSVAGTSMTSNVFNSSSNVDGVIFELWDSLSSIKGGDGRKGHKVNSATGIEGIDSITGGGSVGGFDSGIRKVTGSISSGKESAGGNAFVSTSNSKVNFGEDNKEGSSSGGAIAENDYENGVKWPSNNFGNKVTANSDSSSNGNVGLSLANTNASTEGIVASSGNIGVEEDKGSSAIGAVGFSSGNNTAPYGRPVMASGYSNKASSTNPTVGCNFRNGENINMKKEKTGTGVSLGNGCANNSNTSNLDDTAKLYLDLLGQSLTDLSNSSVAVAEAFAGIGPNGTLQASSSAKVFDVGPQTQNKR